MTDQEFIKITALPSLSQFLPITFSNGSRVTGIATCCSVCEKEISPENMRVDIAPYEHCCALETYSLCYDCHMITAYKMRLSDEGYMLVAREDGTWTKASYTKPKDWYSLRKTLMEKWKEIWTS